MAPKEHGAWAILIAPVAVGLIAAAPVEPAAAFLFCLGALGGFLVRTPLQALLADRRDPRARRWLAIYGLLAAAGFVPLLLVWERGWLLAFAAPVAWLLWENLDANRTGRRFSAFNEAAGVFGLCLGGPAAAYAATGRLGPRDWTIWVVCALYFLGPIFHVKMAALQHRASADPRAAAPLRRAIRATAAYHAATTLAVALWSFRGGLPLAAAVPFAAALAKTLSRAAKPPAKVDFRALGFAEVGYSLLFVAALAFAVRA